MTTLTLETDYVDEFCGKLCDDLLGRNIFSTLLEAKVRIERYRQACNTVRPHNSLRYHGLSSMYTESVDCVAREVTVTADILLEDRLTMTNRRE